jgi:hypothetical protein
MRCCSRALQIVDGKFRDDRWDPVQGRWIISMFKGADGEVNWDKVRLPAEGL